MDDITTFNIGFSIPDIFSISKTQISDFIVDYHNLIAVSYPPPNDIRLTEKIFQAASIIDILVYEHLTISLFDDRYYSFADKASNNKLKT